MALENTIYLGGNKYAKSRRGNKQVKGRGGGGDKGIGRSSRIIMKASDTKNKNIMGHEAEGLEMDAANPMSAASIL